MAKRPYTHEWYLRSKETRKKATDKWLSNPDNKQKIRSFQRDYYRQRYQNEPEYREYFRAYQRQYRKSTRSDLVRFQSLRERQRKANKRFKERKFLKSVNGDLIKFAEYLEKPPCETSKEHVKPNRAKANFKAIVRNLTRRANLVAIYGGCCAMCGEENGTPLHLHHINGDGGRERSALSFHHIISEAITHPNWVKYQLLCETCHRETHHWFWFFDHRT